jgi:hypothetical protein
MKKKSGMLFSLAIVVLLFVFGVYFILLQVKENNNYDMKVNAVVKRVETKLYKRKSGERNKDKYKYKAICEYVVNEKKYTYETDWSERKYSKGDTIVVKVNSEDPEKINEYGKGTVGAFAIFIGLFQLKFTLRKYRH